MPTTIIHNTAATPSIFKNTPTDHQAEGVQAHPSAGAKADPARAKPSPAAAASAARAPSDAPKAPVGADGKPIAANRLGEAAPAPKQVSGQRPSVRRGAAQAQAPVTDRLEMQHAAEARSQQLRRSTMGQMPTNAVNGLAPKPHAARPGAGGASLRSGGASKSTRGPQAGSHSEKVAAATGKKGSGADTAEDDLKPGSKRSVVGASSTAQGAGQNQAAAAQRAVKLTAPHPFADDATTSGLTPLAAAAQRRAEQQQKSAIEKAVDEPERSPGSTPLGVAVTGAAEAGASGAQA